MLYVSELQYCSPFLIDFLTQQCHSHDQQLMDSVEYLIVSISNDVVPNIKCKVERDSSSESHLLG